MCVESEPAQCQEAKSNCLLNAYDEAPAVDKGSLLESFILGLPDDSQHKMIELILKNKTHEISRDVGIIQKRYDNISQLKDLNVNDYIKERNDTVVTVLGALTMSTPSAE